jgi:two-component system chemotaxis response regulator CheB
MINVLVVDDSAVARSLVMHILGADPEIQVIGTASNGEEALKAVERRRPDVVTMDINMPRMDGLEATRQIMETCPTPIVIVSGLLDNGNANVTFRALEAGALAAQAMPPGLGHPSYAARAEELVRTVKLMSEVKVVRRWARLRDTTTGSLKPGSQITHPLTTGNLVPGAAAVEQTMDDGRTRKIYTIEGVGKRLSSQPSSSIVSNILVGPSSAAGPVQPPAPGTIKLVAIGASTGGPPVLRTILADLPPDFPAPIAIVQHIAAGFTRGFAEWLASSSKYPVLIPRDGDRLLGGKAYVAPDGMHLGVGPGNRATLSAAAPEHGMRPSVSYLFRSVAGSMGLHALGVLLTGMGTDGAIELKSMRDLGAITIAQDFETSVVFGMPGEAMRLGGVTYVRPAGKIGGLMAELAGVKREV